MSGGTILLMFALLFALISSIYYLKTYVHSRNRNEEFHTISYWNYARISYYFMTTIVVISSVLLWIFIFANKFQYSYVANYSSRSLPLLFKISAFWAGQQGSFLFWTLMISLLGLIFVRMAGKFEPLAMVVVNGVIAFFIILMFKANPFAKLPFTPADGSGLNPLLQNFWMAIHPPILFVGYAAATFHFALAIAGFIQKAFENWITIARKWAIFSSFALGAGIIIGAFWAYEVLGWGGYWGWDPVENSSLIPWLLILALIHGFILQKRNGQFIRTNFWLAVFSFILVLYATFLTRSGVLADFSVHSFQDDGLAGLLMAFMASALITGIVVFSAVATHIPRKKYSSFVLSREFIVFLSMFIFVGSAILIFVGTSFPIISGFFGQPTKVDISFYNITNLPIAVLASLLLLLAPLLHWNQFKLCIQKHILILPFFAGLITVYISYRIGITNPFFLLLLFFSMNSIIVLIYSLSTTKAITFQRAGAILSHLGVVIFFIGMIINGNLKTNHQLVLPQNEAVTFQNRVYQFLQYEKSPDGKDLVRVLAINDNSKDYITPRFYYSQYNKSYMREPYIVRNFFYDTYYSPIQIQAGEEQGTHLILGKQEEKQFGELNIQFVKFHMDQHGEGNEIKVGTELKVKKDEQEFTVIPAIIFSNGQRKSESKELILSTDPPQKLIFSLEGIDANAKKVKLHIDSPENDSLKQDILVMEVKNEPFIGFVWLGFFLIISGNVLPIVKTERS